eukprot:719212-Karenia_brevis.AAC.1
MREVGANVRHSHLQTVRGNLTDDVVLAAVARAAFYNNLGLASFLLKHQHLAREFIEVKNGTVFLKDAIRFADLFANTRRGRISAEIASLQADSGDSIASDCRAKRREQASISMHR